MDKNRSWCFYLGLLASFLGFVSHEGESTHGHVASQENGAPTHKKQDWEPGEKKGKVVEMDGGVHFTLFKLDAWEEGCSWLTGGPGTKERRNSCAAKRPKRSWHPFLSFLLLPLVKEATLTH